MSMDITPEIFYSLAGFILNHGTPLSNEFMEGDSDSYDTVTHFIVPDLNNSEFILHCHQIEGSDAIAVSRISYLDPTKTGFLLLAENIPNYGVFTSFLEDGKEEAAHTQAFRKELLLEFFNMAKARKQPTGPTSAP